MDYIQELIQLKKNELHGKNVDYVEFQDMLQQIGEINEKYKLEQQVLYEKQECKVTIEGIEALIIQCLLEEQNYIQNDLRNKDIGEVEVQNINNIQTTKDKLTQSYSDLTIDSTIQLLLIYKRAVNIKKQENKDKCDLQNIIKEIENQSQKGNLQIEKEKVINIFSLLSRKQDDETNLYVYNDDLQHYISKFENYLLLNKYGQKNVENNQQTFVFHESDEDEDQNTRYSMDMDQKEISQNNSYQTENQTSLKTIEMNDKTQNNFIFENSDHFTMRELYPILADLAIRDEQSKTVVDQIETICNKFQIEIQTLSQQNDDKDTKIQDLLQQNQLHIDAIRQIEQQLQHSQNLYHDLDERSNKVQDQVYKLNLQIAQHEKRELEQLQLQKQLEINIKEKEQNIIDQKNEIQTLNKVVTEKQKLLEEYYTEIEKLNKEKNIKIEEIQLTHKRAQSYNEKQNNEQMNQMLYELKSENGQLKLSNEYLKNQLQDLSLINDEKDEYNEQLKTQMISLKKQISILNDNLMTISDTSRVENLKNNSENNFIQQKSLKEEAFDCDFFSQDHQQSKADLSKEQHILANQINFNEIILEQESGQSEDSIQKYDSIQNCQQIQKQQDSIKNDEQDQNNNNSQQENLKKQVKQESHDQIQDNNLGNKRNEKSAQKGINKQKIKQNFLQVKQNSSEKTKSNQLSEMNTQNEQQEQNSIKKGSCFSFAALEIIQTSRQGQTVLNIEECDGEIDSSLQLQSKKYMSDECTLNYNSSSNQSGDQINQTTKADISDKLQSENESSQFNSLSMQNKKLVDQTGQKKPSFLQVLKGDTSYYWNQLSKIDLHFNACMSSESPNQNSAKHGNMKLVENNQKYVNASNFHSFIEDNTQVIPQIPNTDYLSIRNDERIIKLRQLHENQTSQQQGSQRSMSSSSNLSALNQNFFYSDSIYRINAKNEKERRIICITYYYVYILNPNEDFKLVRYFKVRLINKITFSNTNSNLCVIHVMDQSDYVIESCRRFDLNIFLSTLFRYYLKLPIYMVSFAESIKIISKKQEQKYNSRYGSPPQKPKVINNARNVNSTSQDSIKRKRSSEISDQLLNRSSLSKEQNINDLVNEFKEIENQLKKENEEKKLENEQKRQENGQKNADNEQKYKINQQETSTEIEFILKSVQTTQQTSESNSIQEKLEQYEIKMIDQELERF